LTIRTFKKAEPGPNIPEITIPEDNEITVLARDPLEMAEAQKGLVAWATKKVQLLKSELRETELNLKESTKLKIRTAGWKRQVALAKGRVVYYEKVKAALEAGYCIVPNFPNMEVIAVRTGKRSPRRSTKEATGYVPSDPDVKYQQLPEGEGKYVSPRPTVRRTSYKNAEGKSVMTVWADDFRDVDFPFKTVRPQIVQNLGTAMAKKIFDEIGVLPQINRRQDPMIIGRIRRREQGYMEPTITFLIAWWIDTKAL
jgi:hypothetical protein